jgi:hypothetical protein
LFSERLMAAGEVAIGAFHESNEIEHSSDFAIVARKHVSAHNG